MNRRKPTPAERVAYFASIAHLQPHFDLERVRPFSLSTKSTATVDYLLSKYNIPAELKTDIHWIFGYVGMQYTVDFEPDKARWKKERDKARNPKTAEGINLYHYLGQGHLKSETVEKITITLKGTPKTTYTIAYPELIYFILQATMEKFGEKPEEDETGMKDIIQEDAWNVEKFTEYDKWKTADYLTFRKQETINEIDSYLSHKLPELGTDARCRFGSELMFEAGVPFRHGRGKKAPLHDTFVEDIKDQYFSLAQITPRIDPTVNRSARLQALMDRIKR